LPKKKGWFSKTGSTYHAVHAGKQCLKLTKHISKEIQIFINTGIYRDGHILEPAIAAILQDKLKINNKFQGRRTFSFDLFNGGCGMLNGIHVFCGLVKAGTVSVAMIIASEANTDPRPDPNYKYPESGASLLLDISPDFRFGFGEFVFKSYPQYFTEYNSYIDASHKKGTLKIEKKENIEDIYITHATEVLDEILEKEKLKKEDIDFLIPSQISPSFIQKLSQKFSFPANKIIDVTNMYSDTLTTSMFLAFHYAQEQKMINQGKKVLFFSCGSGVNLGATIYYCF
jgi:3-oxoacyl-[acyl-carrier-protein] synthase-3